MCCEMHNFSKLYISANKIYISVGIMFSVLALLGHLALERPDGKQSKMELGRDA